MISVFDPTGEVSQSLSLDLKDKWASPPKMEEKVF